MIKANLVLEKKNLLNKIVFLLKYSGYISRLYNIFKRLYFEKNDVIKIIHIDQSKAVDTIQAQDKIFINVFKLK